jgi:hypothetical protein
MNPVFINGLFAAPPAVAGVQLVPLTLGHALLLDIIGNYALVLRDNADKPREPSSEELAVALWVCSKTWNEAMDGVQCMDLSRELKEWTALVSKQDRADVLKVWAFYVQMYFVFAEAWIDTEARAKRRPPITPWEYQVASSLIRNGHPEDRVWNMVLPLAMAYFTAHNEGQGFCEYVSEEQAAIIKGLNNGDG